VSNCSWLDLTFSPNSFLDPSTEPLLAGTAGVVLSSAWTFTHNPFFRTIFCLPVVFFARAMLSCPAGSNEIGLSSLKSCPKLDAEIKSVFWILLHNYDGSVCRVIQPIPKTHPTAFVDLRKILIPGADGKRLSPSLFTVTYCLDSQALCFAMDGSPCCSDRAFSGSVTATNFGIFQNKIVKNVTNAFCFLFWTGPLSDCKGRTPRETSEHPGRHDDLGEWCRNTVPAISESPMLKIQIWWTPEREVPASESTKPPEIRGVNPVWLDLIIIALACYVQELRRKDCQWLGVTHSIKESQAWKLA
jgi:hypothetical protein